MKKYLPYIFLSIIFVTLLVFLSNRNSLNFIEEQKNIPTITQQSQDILITSPSINDSVSSPFQIIGKVKSSWMFEGSFSVELLDNNHLNIAQSVCSEINPGSWVTEGMVDFVCDLKFQTNNSGGYLKFMADNPSGLPQNEKTYVTPIKLTPTDTALQNWKTYKNEEYGFEFQYPTELNVNLEFENTYPSQTIINLIPDIYDPDKGKSNSIGINIYKNQEKHSSSDWMKNNFSHSNFTNQNYENIIIAGISGYRYVAEATGKITITVFSYQNNIFVLNTYGYEKYLDQILSTFKFTKQSVL